MQETTVTRSITRYFLSPRLQCIGRIGIAREHIFGRLRTAETGSSIGHILTTQPFTLQQIVVFNGFTWITTNRIVVVVVVHVVTQTQLITGRICRSFKIVYTHRRRIQTIAQNPFVIVIHLGIGEELDGAGGVEVGVIEVVRRDAVGRDWPVDDRVLWRDGPHAVFDAAARKLSDARMAAAEKLDLEILAELGPLRLDKARFETRVETDEARAGAHGIDRVEFLIAANPGTPLAPIVKAASGGELSRFLLALKVVLAARASAPTLIFVEIDTGVGGAVADAIGQRLARLSRGLQVLAVTHSPQVASRADHHMLISKIEEAGDADGRRMITRVMPLSGDGRREEIARMLSGAEVTTEARAQADRLLAGTG